MTHAYFDHNATEPVSAAALKATTHALQDLFANPSSPHAPGQAARKALSQARASVAGLLGCSPHALYFTASATESCNLAVHSLLRLALRSNRRHVLVSPLEHPAVLAPLRLLASLAAIQIEWLPLRAQGVLDPQVVAQRLRPDTGLVCCMAAHNELGTSFPVHELAALAHNAGAFFHCDATQAAGKLPLSLQPADTIAISGHKLGAPKGVGALYIAPHIEPTPLVLGGGQENGVRSGTENIPGIMGFAAAAQERLGALPHYAQHTSALRDLLWTGLQALGATRNTPTAGCLPNTLHVSFPHIDGATLAKHLDQNGFAVSTGSACLHLNPTAAGQVTPVSQHTQGLQAAHLSPHEVAGAIRFSFGLSNRPDEVERLLALLPSLLERALIPNPKGT